VIVPQSSDGRLEIRLTGMRFHRRVGVLPHERELAQPLEVDLAVRRHLPASDILDYRTLYAIVRDVLRPEPLDYLETLGDAIAARAMAGEAVRRGLREIGAGPGPVDVLGVLDRTPWRQVK